MKNDTALAGTSARELVIAARSGTDVAPPAIERLLAMNEGLCRKAVLDVRRNEQPPNEDLMQVARIAFVKAIESFNFDRGSLSTFAYAVMHRAVLKAATREAMRTARLPTTPLDEVLEDSMADEKGIAKLDLLVERLDLRTAFVALPSADRDLLRRIYNHDLTQTAVAADLRVSHTAVYKRHRRIIENLRLALSA